LDNLTVSHPYRCNECECRILFIYAQKTVFLILFENDVAELSDCDCHSKATQLLQSVCGIYPQFYSATTSAESEICWNPETAIRRIETGSKTSWFEAYPKYSVPIHKILKMLSIFTQFVISILSEIAYQ